MTQDQAFDIMRLGRNVFLTGAAGNGKSYLVRKYVEYLNKNKVHVGVTASTGIAATQIDGRTIHSWAGIGINDNMTDKELTKLFYNNDVRSRITEAKVLIIDEISMLGANILDLIDRVCKKLKQSKEPFGGTQVILCGDFFQLPPIPNRETGEPVEFAFASQVWREANFAVCYLEKQYRQTDDQYLEILNNIRHSNVTDALLSALFSRHGKSIHGVAKPTKLYTHNVDVDAINAMELAALPSEPVQYRMTTKGDPKLVHTLKKYCMVPEILELKKDAMVMFVKNNQGKGYVNGTLGTVIGFDKDDNYPIVETLSGRKVLAKPSSWKVMDEEEVQAEIVQVPIRLAWAITVHKSQGMSLDAAEIDLSKAFAEGMGYVALSRVRTLAGIKLDGLNEMALRVNPEITELDNNLKAQSETNVVELKKIGARQKKKLVKEFVVKNKTIEEDISDIPF
ncbi:MAG: PIF1 family DEAD/DEAH box helicase [Terrimicrobiaceae bacterium]|nr:PIF1 family DEAD/DEAH box helicase [Terrimicrobiaceae bacterium]